MKQRYSDATARTKAADSADSVEYDDYAPVFQKIMMEISSILLIRKESAEALVEKDELWQYLKKKDLRLYVRLRYGFLGRMVNMPGEAGRKFAVKGYELVQKYYGFN